jgi:DivIVA domain-containing protein
VAALLAGADAGLAPAQPDGRAAALPEHRCLAESDVAQARFDQAFRGYRMDQVDRALRRLAYDIGYKDELIAVLEAEVTALRAGRLADADALARARQAAPAPATAEAASPEAASPAPATPEAATPDHQPDLVDDSARVSSARG